MTKQLSVWFYGLPIWNETDNYIYFIMAGAAMFLLNFDADTLKAIGGALVGALIMKGKGNGGNGQ